MSKRARDSTRAAVSTACNRKSLSIDNITNRGKKRPRTAQFLWGAANYENIMQTCSHFRTELVDMTSSKEESPETRMILPRGRAAHLVSCEKNIQKQMSEYQKRFLSKCQALKIEADGTIRISDAFDCFERAIYNRNKETECLLPMLSQGPETTAGINKLISDFAGRPSNRNVDDMKQLQQVVSKFC